MLVYIEPNAAIIVDTDNERFVMVFALLGDAAIGDKLIKEKTADKLTSGDHVKIKATDKKAQVLFVSSSFLHEPVVWSGPIVMNTKKE